MESTKWFWVCRLGIGALSSMLGMMAAMLAFIGVLYCQRPYLLSVVPMVGLAAFASTWIGLERLINNAQ